MDKCILGFTGTQRGMRSSQIKGLIDFLDMHDVVEFHHGDCIGADAEAHEIACSRGIKIIIHPPVASTNRAFKRVSAGGEVLSCVDYITRNHDIVDACDVLFAAPFDDERSSFRSGTWATVRYARKHNKNVIVF